MSIDGSASNWFDAPSRAAGAALAGRLAERSNGALPALDLRDDGVRVRVGTSGSGLTNTDLDVARTISEVATELGLIAEPAALQEIRIDIAAADPQSIRSFWQPVLGYQLFGDGLTDPLHRDPAIAIRPLDGPSPLRNRIHLDVVRPAQAVTSIRSSVGQQPYGSYGLTLADEEGNEVDAVPGDLLSSSPETSDWRAVFSAMTFYPTTSAAQASDLATVVAELADQAELSLLIDLRPDGVTIDSGKDLWEDDGHGRADRFLQLAARVQTAAAGLGLTADPSGVRFVQLGIDAVDIPAVRTFWAATLGYAFDERDHVTDLYDPRRLNPVIFFQDLDPADEARRRQRGRIRLQLCLPAAAIERRVATATAAGGRVIDGDGSGPLTLADPEGNELVVVASR